MLASRWKFLHYEGHFTGFSEFSWEYYFDFVCTGPSIYTCRMCIGLHTDLRIWNACQYKNHCRNWVNNWTIAGRQRVHFSILQPFLLTTYGYKGRTLLESVRYLHIEVALHANKNVPSCQLVFSCFYTMLQLVTVKYHKVEALFSKMSWRVKKKTGL